MAPKPVYVLDGERWLPIARAAIMLAANSSAVKRLLSDDRIAWRQLHAGSTTLLVRESDVIALRRSTSVLDRERRRRATASTRDASARGRAMACLPSHDGRTGAAGLRHIRPHLGPLPVATADREARRSGRSVATMPPIAISARIASLFRQLALQARPIHPNRG